MNYSELTTNIQDICENTFTADQLAMFVQQAEQRIYNTVQLASLRKNVTAVIAPDKNYIPAPTDFLAAYSLAVIDSSGAYEFLLNKDTNFIREAYPNPKDLGKPRFYAIFGGKYENEKELTLIIGPTPDQSYEAELHYFYYPESIVTAGDTWLGENFDAALLNGSLVEAIRFMKGEKDLVDLYEKMYVQSVTLLKNLGDGKQRSDAYRSGQVRTQVI